MIANPCAMSTRLNRTPRANVLILLFFSASFVPWKVQIAMRSANKTPPTGGINGRNRDNTCDEIGNNDRAQHVHSTNGAEDIKSPSHVHLYIRPARSRLSISNFRINFQPRCQTRWLRHGRIQGSALFFDQCHSFLTARVMRRAL